MSKSDSTRSTGISVTGLLGVAFVILKLCHVINWSWWWVTAPFWAGLALLWVIFAGVGIVAVIVALAGCTNAQWAQVTSLGSPADIVCYSGGRVIYQGRSTGKVSTEQGSDGWFFQDAADNRLVRVSGQCVVKN